MITLHIAQLLDEQGFGTIDTDLFWEKLPIDIDGIYIISRGGEAYRNRRLNQNFDIYSRHANDLLGADKLEKIWEYITDDGIVCDLPIVPGVSNKEYKRVRIIPISNLENLGEDEAGRKIWRWSYTVNYIKEIV
jgi:hypothetical protein